MLEREQHRLDAMRSRPALARPQLLLDGWANDVTGLRDRAHRALRHRLSAAGEELRHTLARLRGLSPAATMARGYAIVQGPTGQVVYAEGDVGAGDRLRIRLAHGELAATVDPGRPR
jgi:exodeoxyribonuclease VII large subunit